MAYPIKVSTRYGTHLPCLMKAMDKTSGDVLEIGIGVFSTPFLHYRCILDNRKLVSYENYPSWYKFFAGRYGYNYGTHEINFIEKYVDIPVDRMWDIVFIDQTPEESRAEEAVKFAQNAKYVVIHDSSPKFERQYHYAEKVYPHFKYRTDWTIDSNNATVLSNFVDLKDFWK